MISEFCSQIKIIPVSDISVLPNNQYRLSEGKEFETLECLSIPASLIKHNSADAGDTWSVKEDLIINKVTEDIAQRFSYMRHAVMILTTTDGREVVFGDTQYPVLSIITRGLQTDTLSISLKTTVRPLI